MTETTRAFAKLASFANKAVLIATRDVPLFPKGKLGPPLRPKGTNWPAFLSDGDQEVEARTRINALNFFSRVSFLSGRKLSFVRVPLI
jgi:hypothetical protein